MDDERIGISGAQFQARCVLGDTDPGKFQLFSFPYILSKRLLYFRIGLIDEKE